MAVIAADVTETTTQAKNDYFENILATSVELDQHMNIPFLKEQTGDVHSSIVPATNEWIHLPDVMASYSRFCTLLGGGFHMQT